MNYIAHYESPLGGITLACDGEAVTGLWFDGQKHYMSQLHGPCKDVGRLVLLSSGMEVLSEARSWLDSYFSGICPARGPILRTMGTSFRQRVWEELQTISYGQTITYGQIARRLGVRSAQAVGGAVGHNPISLMIPCHRVIGAGGKLTGYDAGLERKQWLLRLEGATFWGW
ncbi:MAG: methylated-DNA--[Bacteroidaceae bacterium]|nr:methylated-DNA--[protein]-cysteine S-methyltransferase [Bacteroidaceae bacterium]